jgi:hypothetical protein
MLINKGWDFETALDEISKAYRPGGITTGPLRNRQVEAWGQLVGRTRALPNLIRLSNCTVHFPPLGENIELHYQPCEISGISLRIFLTTKLPPQ